MKDITIYRFSRSLSVVEDGVCSLERALREVELCSTNAATHFESAEQAIQATSFGLSSTKKDFIEISFSDPNSMTVYFDRLHFPSKIAKVFSSKGHFWIEGTRQEAQKIVEEYFILPRADLEARYSSSLCR